MLFDPPARFAGLPLDGFDVFTVEDRRARREAIVRAFHPALQALGDDLAGRLGEEAGRAFHVHLPRLDWPRGYQPFCTWLALSHMAHGYQAAPQLNVGVHADRVLIRMGWDTAAASFLRFEFLWLQTDVSDLLSAALAADPALRIRVYAAAPWPKGSRTAFESADDVKGSFRSAERIGVFWEVGERLDLADPSDRATIASAALGERTLASFRTLLPLYERLT